MAHGDGRLTAVLDLEIGSPLALEVACRAARAVSMASVRAGEGELNPAWVLAHCDRLCQVVEEASSILPSVGTVERPRRGRDPRAVYAITETDARLDRRATRTSRRLAIQQRGGAYDAESAPGSVCESRNALLRRCAILYLMGSDPFRCRICASLTYTTSQRGELIRTTRKSVRARERLGWDIGEPHSIRPRGMHRRTWERLVAEYVRASEIASKNLGD